MEILNVLFAVVITIIYLSLAIKIISSFLHHITKPLNLSTWVLLAGGIIGFGINLNDFSEIATSSFFMFGQEGSWGYAVGFWLFSAVVAFLFSYILFRLSFMLMAWTTPENEKAELAKNNVGLSLLHALVFVILCYVLSSPITLLANTMVGYSDVPN